MKPGIPEPGEPVGEEEYKKLILNLEEERKKVVLILDTKFFVKINLI